MHKRLGFRWIKKVNPFALLVVDGTLIVVLGISPNIGKKFYLETGQ